MPPLSTPDLANRSFPEHSATARAAAPAGEQRLWTLDALRAAAIVFVFAFHFPKVHGHSVFGPWARNGWIGVDLFFVLSGYLIGNQILKNVTTESFSYRRFYISRFLRTLPVYYFILVLYFVVPGFRENPELPPLWKFLTFTQNFGLSSSAFSHAWSLCIEEQFYLVCPLAIAALYRIRRPAITFAFVAAVFAGGLLYRHFAWMNFHTIATDGAPWGPYLTHIYYPTWGRLDALVFGVGLAALEQLKPGLWSKLADARRWCLLAGFAGLYGTIVLMADRLSWAATVFGFPLLALSFVFILAGVRNLRSRPYRAIALAIRTLAVLSYSFYLVHKEVLHLAENFWKPPASGLPQILFAVASFTASLVAAYFMYRWIEAPFLRWRGRLLRHPRA